MAQPKRPLAFHVGRNGCWHCISHALNHDGYCRIRWAWGYEMLHRTIWRLHNGDIPDGHEIDHLCGSRDCCNPSHLRCIPRAEHLEITNRSRYSARRDEARRYWETHRCTGTALAERFGVSFSKGCLWIREWKTNL